MTGNEILDAYLAQQDKRLQEYQRSLGLLPEAVEELTGNGSPEQRLHDNVQKRMTENPKLTYAMALRELSRENPALYEQYRQAVKTA
jgi:hypothetical protein